MLFLKLISHVWQGVTSVIYNTIGTSSTSNRKKREAETTNISLLYIAFKSVGKEPINMQFTAETSTKKVKVINT